MKNLLIRIVIVLVVLLLFGTAVIPPKDKLKLGKDLAGGTTLTYAIGGNESGEPPTRQDVEQVITVIRDRIDPNGVYDISIVAQGTEQIEISMPAPSTEVVAARQQFEAMLADLGKSSLEESQVNDLVRLAPAERETRIAALSEGMTQREAALREAVAAYDEMVAAREAYDAVKAEMDAALAPFELAVTAAEEVVTAAEVAIGESELPMNRVRGLNALEGENLAREMARLIDENAEWEPLITAYLEAQAALDQATTAQVDAQTEWDEQLIPLEDRAAQADYEFAQIRTKAARTSIDIEEVRRALDRDTASRSMMQDGRAVELASPQEQAIQRLKDDYPALSDQIVAVADAFNTYKSLTRGYDDPKELIALLKGAGVLNFRIAPQPNAPLPFDTLRSELKEFGPTNIQSSTQVRWYPVDDLSAWWDTPEQQQVIEENPYGFFLSKHQLIADSFDGQVYMLLYNTTDKALSEASGPWKATGASPSIDNLGRPAVSFNLDANGAKKFSELTQNNLQEPMAITLDGRVYSIATIQSRIGASGQITGRFSQDDIDYLVQVLSAGALQARLSEEPIAINTIGPRLGADNLRRGLEAGILSLTIVGIFMMCYYFMAGFVAVIALACNAILILGAMALNQAAFTMPGIAGIVLTFGMAVDANVLIYERIREEAENGADLKTSIRLGYEKALSTIIDANVTNLIVCFVLGFTATAEVKGFAITLGIGIIATLFSALFITRQVFTLMTDFAGLKSLPMLPTVWQGLSRILRPDVNWVKIRHLVWVCSSGVVIAALSLTYFTWTDMLDTEFRGGTAVTFSFKSDDAGQPIMMPRAEVEQAIKDYADTADLDQDIPLAEREGKTPEELQAIVDDYFKGLSDVTVQNFNIEEVTGDDFRGSSFRAVTTVSNPAVLERAVITTFGSILDIKQPIRFTGDLRAATDDIPVYQVLNPVLGANIRSPEYPNDVRAFIGGAAVVLRDLQPSASTEEIALRLSRTRQSPEFKRYFGRKTEVIGLERDSNAVDEDGNARWTSVAVVVKDVGVSFFDQPDAWETEVKQGEWTLVVRALTQPESLEQVTTISPAVAAQFRAKAIVAIILSLLGILAYIWIRFGSFRYSLAAIIALVHDVSVTLGLLSLTHYVWDTTFGHVALIEPFKIDLGVIAALLTIIGYSLNDTIVILDRIRENRGKLAVTSTDVVNKSINQTISRTLLTSSTTLLAVIIMYVDGGTGIRPFTFAMLCGVIVGTYSSIGIAAPMVLRGDAK